MRQKYVESLERRRAAEYAEAMRKASNRDERPMHNPNGVEPVEEAGYPGFDTRFAATGPVIGGFATMGIGRYL